MQPNPFFHDAELTKELRYLDGGKLQLSASDVNWKAREPSAGTPEGAEGAQKRPHDALTQERAAPALFVFVSRAPPCLSRRRHLAPTTRAPLQPEESIFLRAFLWREGHDPAWIGAPLTPVCSVAFAFS